MLKKFRIVFALILLALSLALLVWALWPGVVESRVIPVSPEDLQLPDVGAFIAYWVV